MKVLAITNRERAPAFPEVPTAAEAGYPALAFDGLVGLFGPRSMASELRERIASDVRAVLYDPTIATRLAATGQLVSPGTSAAFAAEIEEQRAKVAAIAQVLGIKSAPLPP